MALISLDHVNKIYPNSTRPALEDIDLQIDRGDFVFLVGADSVAGLPRWKDYDALVRLCTFRSFPRTRESSTEVRRRLAAGEPVDDLVPPAVAKFLL